MNIESELELLMKLKKYAAEYLYVKDPTNDKIPNYPENPVLKHCSYLLEQVNIRLSHICNHKIVSDIIDIDPDKSKQILYCEKCETTF
jgi:hypothetical protein